MRFALALIVALALTACGSVPQPFRGSPKAMTDNPLVDIPAAMGVELLPVSGLKPETSDRLTRAVADQLLMMEIPAEPVPKPGSLGFIVSSRAGASVTSPGGEQFDVTWTIRSVRGALVGQFDQTVSLPPEGPVAAATPVARQVAYAMGLTDEETVLDPASGGPAASAPKSAKTKPALPTISVKPVEGAPGDGRDSLRLAILQALTDAGLKRDDVNPDITLISDLTAKPQDLESQDVIITWHAMLRDGRELGQLHLENVIPNGALDRAWGPTAFAIAAAAQPNLVKLVTTQPGS